MKRLSESAKTSRLTPDHVESLIIYYHHLPEFNFGENGLNMYLQAIEILDLVRKIALYTTVVKLLYGPR